MKKSKRALVVTTVCPFDLRGACQQDRAYGVKHLRSLGYEVTVITLAWTNQLKDIPNYEKEFDARMIPLVYEGKLSFTRWLQRLSNPYYIDGAAFEITRRDLHNLVATELNTHTYDFVWCDYSYLWPLFPAIKKFKVPIISRSINYEPGHFYNRVPHTLSAWLRYQSKILGEKRMLRETDLLFSITPKEKHIYDSFNIPTPVIALPLRALGTYVGKYHKPISTAESFNVFYMGSNYLVPHMAQALRFILEEVNPLLQTTYPGVFKIHFTGSKMPAEIVQQIQDGKHPNVTYHGFVKDLDAFLDTMDIAISPSLSGEGMQQKIFESLVRGIPTITNSRGLVGYPFYAGIHYIDADSTASSYVHALGRLADTTLRTTISQNAIALSTQLFRTDIITKIIETGIQKVTPTHE